MAWGGTLKEEFVDEESPSGGYPSLSTRDLMNYFIYHPKVSFGRTYDRKSLGALGANMRRLAAVYPPESIRRAVDRFYMTRTASNHPYPALAFCNREFQDALFEGAPVDIQDHTLLFIANGFSRTDDMDLPWDAEWDAEIRSPFVVDLELNVLARTYPDVVAEILTLWARDKVGVSPLLDGAVEQHKWICGENAEPSTMLRTLADHFTIPKDFMVRNRPRKTQDTLSEAVRIARGR